MDEGTAQKTHLYSWHKAQAKLMMPFAGFSMPIRYKGISTEHLAVRNAVGIFDVTHMARIDIKGPDAVNFVDSLVTNNVQELAVGEGQYALMCNPNGGVIDDLIYYRREDDWIFLVANAGNHMIDWKWLNDHTGKFDVKLTDVSDDVPMFAVQGPKAIDALQKIANITLQDIPKFGLQEGKIGTHNVTFARSGYTGEDGFEICQFTVSRDNPSNAIDLWDAILDAGAEYGIEPCGLGARDTLRLEAGLPLHGNEITPDINPLDARLRPWVKFKKGQYIGSEKLMEIHEQKVKRVRVGLILQERGIPREHYNIVKDGTTVGEVTSGTMSPLIKRGIAMGYVPRTLLDPGIEVDIDIRGSLKKAITYKPNQFLKSIKEIAKSERSEVKTK
ncbi:MAG: glycine cleavage system aminomethyltransferase GcvT [Candidatus Ranarchaeia archaeon]|jgi:aminomethyltransferase